METLWSLEELAQWNGVGVDVLEQEVVGGRLLLHYHLATKTWGCTPANADRWASAWVGR